MACMETLTSVTNKCRLPVSVRDHDVTLRGSLCAERWPPSLSG